ncbi:hypothetical protein GTQ34_15635 [Muricauda sp. JGD-17]|uniref:Activator of Hsp90 ATPase homologue 1/2-like C-terminal domain-containing protein n=1 Tax=Flagellimonas ochracea TaxID=2696472 RepID=A0A964TE97_9FLAO|nr:SRPBCC domain-containing protein [Allomuricauda ochracea]NAY93342.1 hypothetical protein [Allomuricauda ochracea]
MDKIIIEAAILNCPSDLAFSMFTESKHLEKWLTAKADVELKVGGKYELFWEPNIPENNSTLGCKILAFEKPHYITFEWRGPTQYKHFMNNVRPLTQVTVLIREKSDETKVTLIHSGWRRSKEWEEAEQYFANAWRGAFMQLGDYAKSFN